MNNSKYGLKRLKEEELENWLNSSRRKPLVMWGARQVGKTVLIRNFLDNHFKKYIYIDLVKDNRSCAFFKNNVDPKEHLQYIEAEFGIKAGKDCPIVFDEAQNCPRS